MNFQSEVLRLRKLFAKARAQQHRSLSLHVWNPRFGLLIEVGRIKLARLQLREFLPL